MEVKRQLEALWMLCMFLCVALATDFYELLGVDRGASTREIRRAFKKLALTAHPDKNTGDPGAHGKFVRINRAYEVLKDEELRKKYDLHGEEGLSEDNSGGRYESWEWYEENFGIYDEDPEIITLSRSDFEMSVDGTDDIWFINYYSYYCSHCHDLAPTWREMAQSLEGVIRVGAVNCEDDWALCRMQGIHSYPSLVIYPGRERYQGSRSLSSLVKHALRSVTATYHTLNKSSMKRKVYEDTSGQPWLITYCSDEEDCLEDQTCLKLAAMLDGLVKVGKVDCHKSAEFCDTLKDRSGTFFYTDSDAVKVEGMEIDSLVAQDILSIVLHQLPEVTQLDKDAFQSLLEGLKGDQEEAWLVHFVDSKDIQDVELRKLPAMLGGIRVGRVNCRELAVQCRTLHIRKFPTFMTFKESGGAELFYGRMTAHDVAAFAQDSAVTPLTSLDPTDFPDRVINSRDPWFVDFFSPRCPPCMRLLPEFRKAAKSFGQRVNFGTVDCTVHLHLCQTYNIRAYPTTIFYNETEPHQFNGHHSAAALIDFIKDTLKPPVISLTPETFGQLVDNRKETEIWMVDFFAPWCGPCRQLAPEWRQLAKMMQKSAPYVRVAQVDCQKYQGLCREQYVDSYPSIRLYPIEFRGTGGYHAYNGWNRDAGSLQAWAYDFLPSKVETLTWNAFGVQVLDDRGPWLVDFYAPWCGHCQVFKPEFEKVAEHLEGKVKAGKVDCDQFQRLCSQAGVNAYPSIRFYPGSEGPGRRQNPYGWAIQSQNAEEIIHFVKRNLKNKGHDEL